MDLVSIGYFRELAHDLNMTRTAGRLFVSQQTLSNHIRRLEDYFGAPLLHRRPSLALTDAGVEVLAFAEKLGRQEANLRDALAEIAEGERGQLRIGAAPVRGNALLPLMVPPFARSHPRVEIVFRAGITSVVTAMVLRGEIDLGIVLEGEFSAELASERLYGEQVVLCVPESLLVQHYSPDQVRQLKARAPDGLGLADLARLPFSVMTNQLGQRMAGCFQRAGVEPHIAFTGSATTETIPLAMAGLAACYCTQTALIPVDSPLEGMNVFPLLDGGQPIVQDLYLIRHQERVLPGYAREFVDSLRGTAATVERTHPLSIVEARAGAGQAEGSDLR
ncbi:MULTISPECIES: LysR family transcriptional regulator [unclassified Luteococcus]|uniref:LysR family transcriptional regulator n=1 Tax=unclassified Luteococcus TaxID=2639923 RepID=UPI00313E01BA